MFRESDIEWLRVIGCMKKAGMPLKEIRRYIDLVLKGDDTIDERLDMFRRQREALEARMEELRHTIETVDYKCWYYETAKTAGTIDAPRNMDDKDVPEKFRKIRDELRSVKTADQRPRAGRLREPSSGSSLRIPCRGCIRSRSSGFPYCRSGRRPSGRPSGTYRRRRTSTCRT